MIKQPRTFNDILKSTINESEQNRVQIDKLESSQTYILTINEDKQPIVCLESKFDISEHTNDLNQFFHLTVFDSYINVLPMKLGLYESVDNEETADIEIRKQLKFLSESGRSIFVDWEQYNTEDNVFEEMNTASKWDRNNILAADLKPKDIHHILTTHNDAAVRRAAISNKNANSKNIETALKDRDPSVVVAAAFNKNATKKHFNTAMSYHNPSINMMLSTHPFNQKKDDDMINEITKNNDAIKILQGSASQHRTEVAREVLNNPHRFQPDTQVIAKNVLFGHNKTLSKETESLKKMMTTIEDED